MDNQSITELNAMLFISNFQGMNVSTLPCSNFEKWGGKWLDGVSETKCPILTIFTEFLVLQNSDFFE